MSKEIMKGKLNHEQKRRRTTQRVLVFSFMNL